MQTKNQMIEVWKEKSNTLADEMIEFAENFECNICHQKWCEHMIEKRYIKFRKRINKNVLTMVDLVR